MPSCPAQGAIAQREACPLAKHPLRVRGFRWGQGHYSTALRSGFIAFVGSDSSWTMSTTASRAARARSRIVRAYRSSKNASRLSDGWRDSAALRRAPCCFRAHRAGASAQPSHRPAASHQRRHLFQHSSSTHSSRSDQDLMKHRSRNNSIG